MAKEIEGITIKFGANTAEYDSSIHGINQGLKTLKSEFKALNKDLKINPKNLDSLKEKLSNLEQQLTLVKKRNEQYAESLKELGTRTDANAKQFDDLTRKLIDGESSVRAITHQIERLKGTIDGINVSKFDKLQASLKTTGERLESIGKKLAPLSAVSGGILGSAVKSAIDFENAFIGVEKTVDASAKEMERLKQGMIDMSKEIPATVTEIGSIAESAGQLGIETDNILAFTRVMIDLGNTTNISSEEGAMALARFANVTKMSGDDFDRLGSTLVDLGNNFETTEAEIMNMSSRLAGTGAIVGMTQSDILALATSLSSVGIEAEAGGSAISKLLSNMQLSIENGGKELANFARVAGLSTKEFAEKFKSNAVGALNDFIQGLAKMDANGESAIKVLDDMGISEVRMRDAILKSVSANETLASAIDVASKAWDENIALTNEAEKFYGTFANQLKVTVNNITDVGRIIGQSVTPLLGKFNDVVKSLVDKFNSLTPQTQMLISQFLLMATAVAPLTIGIGKMMTLFSGLLTKVKPLVTGIKAFVTGLGGFKLAIGGVVGAMIYAIATNDKIQQSLMNIWNQIQAMLMPILQTVWTFIQTSLIPIFNALIVTLDWLSVHAFQPLFECIDKYVMPVFVGLGKFIADFFNPIVQFLGEVVGMTIGFFDNLFKVCDDLWNKFAEINWIETIIGWFEKLNDIIDSVVEGFRQFVDWCSNAIESAKNWFGSIGDKFGSFFSSGGLGVNAELMASGGLGIRNLTVNAPINVNNHGQQITANEVNGWIEQIADGVSVVLGRRLIDA